LIVLHTTADTDVVIVGAGPVGLFLANECAQGGAPEYETSFVSAV